MPKVSHYNNIYFLSYAHPRYLKCLFINIQEQKSILKSSLVFKKNANFTGKQLENSEDYKYKIFRVFLLNEPKHIVKF